MASATRSSASSVKPGGRLSLQKHHHRAEHWIVVRGAAQVTVNETVKTVHENESIYIPMGAVHRMENPGKIMLELIEVQTGSYLGEDDIIRIEDDYQGRNQHTPDHAPPGPNRAENIFSAAKARGGAIF